MRNVWTVIRSLYAWLGISLLVLLMLLVVGIVRLFDRDPVRYRTGYVFRKMGSWLTKVNPMWDVKTAGAELVKNPRNPYVVVSNHQSMADIPCISLLPWEMKWVSKAVIFKVPLAGLLLRFAGDIAVDRGDKASRGRVYDKARRVLEQKCSVMFFAEGTRSKDNRVLPFHDGAFKLAIATQLPVLPLVVDGSHNCLPKHSWLFRDNARVRIQVLPPIDAKGLTEQDLPVLRNKVRNAIMDQLADWRGVTRLEVDSLIPVATWPEPSPLAQRFKEAMAAMAELQQRISEAAARLPQRATVAAESLNQLERRVLAAMNQLPHLAAEIVEELHERVAAVKAALADWQHRAGEALFEMPRQLAEALEQLSALLRRVEAIYQTA
ncbi:MAG: hypothetical protein GX444_15410 [Myxococcales bacterium]|nr:hypothetical protein [Myxococcales bacterium]